MLTFISFWRAAAIVLCDLGSSAFYAGGIAEQAVGEAAPWFILGIMLFSFAVRAVYVESCSMFTRGGVYRVVKEALGGGFAKLSVSALMFDYILTGPISGVSAGQYITGLMNELMVVANTSHWLPPALIDPKGNPFQFNMNYTSAVFAAVVTIYYWWENIKGIEESSGKALGVMQITTVMVVILFAWGIFSVLFTPGVHLPPAPIPSNLKFSSEALGFLRGHGLPLLGLFGILMAFGHSVLAMSGEESLAQVNREIEHPKLKNLKRAAIVIAIYSLVFTGGATILASMLIPLSEHIKYQDNLIAGLAMYMVGPLFWRIAFRVFVVLVGFLLDRSFDARGRRRCSDRLVSQAASQIRHQLSHHQHGLYPPDEYHHPQPGQYHYSGRGLCFWRDLVVHLQQPGHAGAALEVQGRAWLEGSTQLPNRQH
jgi:amino acid transporter